MAKIIGYFPQPLLLMKNGCFLHPLLAKDTVAIDHRISAK